MRSKTHKGYGRIRANGKWQATHRIAWVLANGPIPAGMHILHACDNPACCEPAHLEIGSNTQNVLEKMERDRSGKKLNVGKVREIKHRLAVGELHADLAEEYGVNPSNITRIATGERWAHVLMKKEKVSFHGV